MGKRDRAKRERPGGRCGDWAWQVRPGWGSALGTRTLPVGALTLSAEEETNGHKDTSEPAKAMSSQGLVHPRSKGARAGWSLETRPTQQIGRRVALRAGQDPEGQGVL